MKRVDHKWRNSIVQLLYSPHKVRGKGVLHMCVRGWINQRIGYIFRIHSTSLFYASPINVEMCLAQQTLCNKNANMSVIDIVEFVKWKASDWCLCFIVSLIDEIDVRLEECSQDYGDRIQVAMNVSLVLIGNHFGSHWKVSWLNITTHNQLPWTTQRDVLPEGWSKVYSRNLKYCIV